jgi:hypothetical protein
VVGHVFLLACPCSTLEAQSLVEGTVRRGLLLRAGHLSRFVLLLPLLEVAWPSRVEPFPELHDPCRDSRPEMSTHPFLHRSPGEAASNTNSPDRLVKHVTRNPNRPSLKRK